MLPNLHELSSYYLLLWSQGSEKRLCCYGTIPLEITFIAMEMGPLENILIGMEMQSLKMVTEP
uniref:Uncharacterized protein n=1 Tax=Anguilla anguilla TaxID=7936 RepID=A0A0E9V1B2_ANGAN